MAHRLLDLAGEHGLLGQVPGRAAADAGGWLATRTPGWRAGVQVVAIDMCSAYRAAVRQHLPHTRLVVDHFHVVQLANRTVAEVRHRVVATVHGRRAASPTPSTGYADGWAATWKTSATGSSRTCSPAWRP